MQREGEREKRRDRESEHKDLRDFNLFFRLRNVCQITGAPFFSPRLEPLGFPGVSIRGKKTTDAFGAEDKERTCNLHFNGEALRVCFLLTTQPHASKDPAARPVGIGKLSLNLFSLSSKRD